MNTNHEVFKLMLMAGLQGIIYESPTAKIERRRAMTKQHTSREPWQAVQLSKAERRGKTPDEIRALRIQKWEAQQGQ
jgi:hypothetical protein